jgi:hypothetical protein
VSRLPLLDFLILNLSPAIAKTLLKLWLKDHSLALDVSTTIVDSLKAVTTDALSRKTVDRQLQAIADRVAQALEQIMMSRGKDIQEDRRQLVADAIVAALHGVQIDAGSLVSLDLAPQNLSRAILDASPSETSAFGPAEQHLYNAVVFELSQYLIDIAAEFPQFSERAAAELLRRDTLLLSIANRIFVEVEEIRKATTSDTEIEVTEFEMAYRRAIVRNLDQMELFGADLSAASKRHSLSVAYVSLRLLPREADRTEETTAVRVEAALPRDTRWLIRGAPGSGKTTLIRWIAVTGARLGFQPPLNDWNGYVPFIISLRQFAERPLPAPLSFPALGAPALGSSAPTQWVRSVLSSGRALLLVDGIDEVPEPRRLEVRDWLKDLCGSYPQSIFIVSSRPHAVEDDWLTSEQFMEADLTEMNHADVTMFIDHWHSAVAGELHDEDEKLRLPELAESLKKTIFDSRPVRNLVGNPLLCALVCALHRDRHGQVPKDRIELYKAGSAMLLERRDTERQIALADYPALTYRQKCALLEDLAYYMLRNGMPQANRSLVDSRFQIRLDSMRDLAATTTGVAVRRFFIERTGMLQVPSFTFVEFTHRTFQEFFAARAALDAGDIGVLVEHAHDDQWREVTILAAGLAGKKARIDLLQSLTARVRKNDEHAVPLLLLTVQCASAALEVSADIRQFLENHMSKLRPPQTVREIRVFGTAGDLGLPYLTFSAKKPEAVLVASVRELVRLGSEGALSVLERYAEAAASGRWPRLLAAITDEWDSDTHRDELVRRIVNIVVPAENALRDLGPVAIWKNLEKLDVSLSHPTSLVGLEALFELREVCIFGFDNATNPEILAGLKPLSKIVLHGRKCFNFGSLPVSSCLGDLQLNGFSAFQGAEHLQLLSLRSLTFSSSQELPPLGMLQRIERLAMLRLRRVHVTTDQLAELSVVQQLEELELSELDIERPQEEPEPKWNDDIDVDEATASREKRERREWEKRRQEALRVDVSWLGKMTKLDTLILDASDRVADFRWLSELRNLTHLTLYHLGAINNLNFLTSLKSVRAIYLYQVPPGIAVPDAVKRKVREIQTATRLRKGPEY